MTTTTDNRYVALVDSGIANLGSVYKALDKLGINTVITAEPGQIEEAAGVVFPGVGAYGQAMNTIINNRLDVIIHKVIQKGTPFLGICLGLQLLFSSSEERSSREASFPGGLGIVPGKVVRFPAGLPVPHVGWNSVDIINKNHPLFANLKDSPYFYFTHSYYVCPDDETVALTKTTYGPTFFTSSIARKNVMGVQFHPEKSGPAGLRLLSNFGNIVMERGCLGYSSPERNDY